MFRGYFLLIAGLALSASVHAFDFLSHADISGESLRLRDVASLEDLPESVRSVVGDLVIARIDTGATQATLSFETLRSAARLRAPILSLYSNGAQTGVIRIHVIRAMALFGSELSRNAQRCSQIVKALESGRAIAAHDVADVACPAKGIVRGSVKYDAWARTAYAARRLETSDVVPLLHFDHAGFVAGENVLIESKTGAVYVQRSVHALQSGRYDEPVAVSGSRGSAFVAKPVAQGDRL